MIVANIVRHSIPSLESLRLQRFDSGQFGFVRVLLVEKFDKVEGMFHFGGRDPFVFRSRISYLFDKV